MAVQGAWAAAGEPGYFFPRNTNAFLALETGTQKCDPCVPYYVYHKSLAGLIDVAARLGDARARAAAIGMGDWAVARVAGVLSGLAPSLILCQPPSDCDPEHHATAALVWAAWRAAEPLADVPLRFYSPGSSAPGGLFRIHYDVLEDVSDHFETKLALCAAFASQMTEPRWRMVRERAAAFGKELGVRFAEPFVSALRGE